MSEPTVLIENEMTGKHLKEKTEILATKLKSKNLSDNQAYCLSSAILDSIKTESEANGLIKKFADAKKDSFGIVTSKDGGTKHTHDGVVIVLNYGDDLIGVTTSTNGTTNHIHTIKLNLDGKIISLEARTNYSDLSNDEDSDNLSDFHRHSFKANIEKIREEVPNMNVGGYYFNEDGELKEKSVPAQENSKSVNYLADPEKINNARLAEFYLLKLSQNEKIEKQAKAKVFNTIKEKYPNLTIYNDSYVAEMIVSLSDKKGDFIFAASSPDVKDNKGHFPIDTIDLANNALARAVQYSEVPKWYGGSLSALKQKVRTDVNNKYSSIKSKGLCEYMFLRFKEDSKPYFLNLGTSNVECAKNDAGIYRKALGDMNMDLVRFSIDDNEAVKFTDLGRIVLYDVKNKTKSGWDHTSETIKFSEDGKLMDVELLREGTFNHELYGQIEITPEKLNEIIKNFNDDVLDREVAFDMNHLPELPAAAWIKSLSIGKRNIKGQDRYVLNAKALPTPGGRKSIEEGEFKYFSAEYTDNFVDKENGKEYGTTLKGGGFTNRPWMPGMAPVQLSDNNIALITKL